MRLIEPKLSTVIVITSIIFLQKIYRHPEEFSFIFNEFNEGFFMFIISIIGLILLFGGVCAFVFLALAIIKGLFEKFK